MNATRQILLSAIKESIKIDQVSKEALVSINASVLTNSRNLQNHFFSLPDTLKKMKERKKKT